MRRKNSVGKYNKMADFLDPWTKSHVQRMSRDGRVGYSPHKRLTTKGVKNALSNQLSWFIDQVFPQRPLPNLFTRWDVIESFGWAFTYYNVDPVIVCKQELNDQQQNQRTSLWDKLSEEL